MDYPSASLVLEQRPGTHAHTVRHVGDSMRITMTLSAPHQGKAFIRTNLGNAAIHRQEVVYRVEMGAEPLGRDWRDLPMRKTGNSLYEIRLPLTEVGIFEYKCFFVDENTGKTIWPRGENAKIKVITALGAAHNSIYNAFVRQFGDNISGGADKRELEEAAAKLDRANYTVIPPSGTFRAVKSKLDFIIGKMGFRILQFLPVHPIPTTFARMGRFGSPFAPLDFLDVDASMGEFDQRTTPLEQFLELVDQIHGRGGMVFLDMPIDHTGWASVMQSHHPEWFARTQDGAFESPGAWGVVWADLCKLDFRNVELWKSLASIFLHWCKHGVDGFRCDAGYMIPAPVWEYIVAKVRQQFPDTIFFLEGLGGGQDATTKLLVDSDLDWAYSELFQNYTKQELSRYLEFATVYSAAHGALVNFAETHDNDRLAKCSPAWARLRVMLSALFAPQGCFGIANGVEWLATEKIDVHEARSLNWGASENLVELMATLNGILKEHPAFRADSQVRVPYGTGGDCVGIVRIPAEEPDYAVLVIANPKPDAPGVFQWHFREFDAGSRPVDIVGGCVLSARLDECLYHVMLRPGQVVCLTAPGRQKLPAVPYGPLERQLLRATALKLRVSLNGNGDLGRANIENDARALYENPRGYLQKLVGTKRYLPVVERNVDSDVRRVMPVPDGHYILLISERPFVAVAVIDEQVRQKAKSIKRADGRHFVFFMPLQRVTRETPAVLRICRFDEDQNAHRESLGALLLPAQKEAYVLRRITRKELTPLHCALATTNLGGYGLVRGCWGTLASHYDALLAANQRPDCPADRTVVLSRVRAWLVHHDYAKEINFNCQTNFAVTDKNSACWRFVVPTGVGGNVYLGIRYELEKDKNRCRLSFTMCTPPEEEEARSTYDADSPVMLILRPDIDDRCNHEITQAFRGAERNFPQRVTAFEDAFAFSLNNGNRLEVRTSRGKFLNDGEWTYNLHCAMEAGRGLPADQDIYSPGHFRLNLKCGETAVLEAAVLTPEEASLRTPMEPAVAENFNEGTAKITLREALENALDAFIVERKPLKTVIAGYPWFLDWGRDTLICLRGLIAAGRLEDALAIIRQFASFEKDGTLPNMIQGDDVANRETTDAPLWLFNAVDEYVKTVGKKKGDAALASLCGKRTLLEVLKSIVDGYIKGTPNGIHDDRASMPIFSPTHYTSMHTNQPAENP
ncbi:MAG: glycogen debranching enzyme N-terminal domain-containing protein, partial [Lentisphaeria bacterium]|nr:glycogen debranching enzyme N-terminal domain-containing protein [Lentisphaeria bacterium]